MESLEKRIAAIERRNAKVENDKAWETSWTRKLTIAALTYLVVVVYLFVIGNDAPFINAVVPPVGFLLSTLVARQVRDFWEKSRQK